ncbi:MAG: hypothetical protein AAFR81_26290 [Chloroflexota bacterium]
MPDTNIPALPMDTRYVYDELYGIINQCNAMAVQGNMLVSVFALADDGYLSENEQAMVMQSAQDVEARYHTIADTLDALLDADADGTLQQAFDSWEASFTSIRISTNMLLQAVSWEMDAQSRLDMAQNIVDGSKQVAKAIPKLLARLQA